MNTRLKSIRHILKMTQPEFGKLCGKSRDAIATYESGRVIPDDTFIKVICLTFNVNEEWLRTGNGSMFIDTKNNSLKTMPLNEQLRKIRKALKMTQVKFAQKIGLSQTSLGMIEVGERKVQDRHIKTICSLFNVNEEWFRTGKGDMFVKTEDDIFKAFADKYNLDEGEQALAKYCLSMTHEERQFLIQHILNMADAIRGKQKLKQSLKPDKELTVDEKLERIRPQLEAAQKGKISTASISTNGLDKNDKVI